MSLERYLSSIAAPPRRQRAKPVDRETPLQTSIVKEIRKAYPNVFVAAIAGGSARVSMGTRMKMKRMGVVAGLADLLLVFEDGAHGWMEVKDPDKNITESSLSTAQKYFRDLCKERNIPHAVVNSVSAALDTVEAWR